MWRASDSTGSQAGDITGLVNYGILGVIVLLGILGYVYFKPSVTDLKAQNAELRHDFDRQVESIRKDYSEQIAALRRDHTEQITLMRTEREQALAKVDAMAEVYHTSLLPGLSKFLTTIEILLPLLQKSVERPGGEK